MEARCSGIKDAPMSEAPADSSRYLDCDQTSPGALTSNKARAVGLIRAQGWRHTSQGWLCPRCLKRRAREAQS